jgi:hypothetical protein
MFTIPKWVYGIVVPTLNHYMPLIGHIFPIISNDTPIICRWFNPTSITVKDDQHPSSHAVPGDLWREGDLEWCWSGA